MIKDNVSLPGLFYEILFVFVLLEFRSFRAIRTIAGPGGVIGPLQGQNRWANHREKVANKAEDNEIFSKTNYCTGNVITRMLVGLCKKCIKTGIRTVSVCRRDDILDHLQRKQVDDMHVCYGKGIKISTKQIGY